MLSAPPLLRTGGAELWPDRYPHAGGDDHTAWYAENTEGFEVEVVAAAS